ncbi:DUF2207 domain-containing protein [Agromyces archimandritae]|uniref:DUF2207 domain-containing protein n=1 Tax=Agromyces archimandritae TaxID=2781962 RepID=A0A975FJE3_9MICO|nr:DUF2207 domain-containing protein [Agromyces archimandritae]QTX03618.1 DUF2207 domain-containing protein [Agromyces archimandritae]
MRWGCLIGAAVAACLLAAGPAAAASPASAASLGSPASLGEGAASGEARAAASAAGTVGRDPASTGGVEALGPVRADVDDFSFASMDADYTLTRADDGTSRLRVVETFVAVFPDTDQNHGMRRAIPDEYNGQPLWPEFVSVTDEHGTPRPAEVEHDEGVFQITSRDDAFLHGAQTFVFTYDVENVTWDFPDTGLEFYWDVNGVDWPQHFGSVTATVHLDAGLAGQLSGRQACYQGVQDSTETCDIAVESAGDGGATITAGTDALGPHETVSIAIGFSDGAFQVYDTSYLGSGWGWAQGVAGAGMLGVVGWAAVVRRRKLRDEPGRPTIIAEYEPPREVDALESAVLLGRTDKAIPAEVLEQAIVGSIRIVELPKKSLGKAKLQAELVDRSLADGDGELLLAGLFREGPPGATYTFGKQDSRLSSAAQRIQKAAATELETRGIRRRVPGGVRAWPIVAAVVLGIVVAFFGIMALGSYAGGFVPIAFMIGAGVVFFIVVAMLARKPLTAKGAEVRDHLKGLEEFIDWAEADRIRMLQSPTGAERRPVDVDDPRQLLKIYEPLLPYAVVFGQEKEWSKRLMLLYTAAAITPVWYYGSGSFDAASFSSSISSLSSAASSSSSTSGGSAGGGSAGGGGGGGGGGGV